MAASWEAVRARAPSSRAQPAIASTALVQDEGGRRRRDVARAGLADRAPVAEHEAPAEGEARGDPDGEAGRVGRLRIHAEPEVERQDDRKADAGIDDARQAEAGQLPEQRRAAQNLMHGRWRNIARRRAAR